MPRARGRQRERACYAAALKALVEPGSDPRAVVQRIADRAWAKHGALLGNCHGLMHTVGREYAPRTA